MIQKSCCATTHRRRTCSPCSPCKLDCTTSVTVPHKQIHTAATHDPLTCTTSPSADIRYSGLALKVIRSLPGLSAALPNSAACDTSSGTFYPYSDMSRTVQVIHSILCWHYKSALNLTWLTPAHAGCCPCARHESLWGSGSIAQHINFGGELHPGLLPAGNDLRYPLNRKLGEFQIRSTCSAEDKN